MSEKPNVVKRVHGLPPVELAARALVGYHIAIEENGYDPDSGEALYYEAQKNRLREMLNPQQQIQALEQASQMIESRSEEKK